jgi:riboflavin biosynthesis pyrimidine reductase
LADAAGVADVLTTGTGAVDLRSALEALGDRGLTHVLCEGGPTLNTGLAAAQLVDELCLTLSPKLAGCVGDGLAGGWLASSSNMWLPLSAATEERTFGGQPLTQLLDLDLAHVLEEDSFLFLRMRARYSGGPAPG